MLPSGYRYPQLGLFVGRQFLTRTDSPPVDVLNPATEECLARLPTATPAIVGDALACAARAFAGWMEFPASARGAVLHRAADLLAGRADEIAFTIVLEQGKPLRQARLEVDRVVDLFRYFGRLAGHLKDIELDDGGQPIRRISRPVPVGVVAAFTAWNFPLVLAGRKLAMALAAGCPVILKAAEETPGAAVELVRALQAAGLPDGYLSLLFGRPADISSQLLAAPVVGKISLTGSIPVGRTLARLAADGVKPASLELGGHSAAIVFADSDIEVAARQIAAAKFANAGQVCTAPSRILVERPAYDRFVSVFTACAEALVVADGLAERVDMGPLAHAGRLRATQAVVEDAVARGGKIVTGGRVLDRKGYFFEPTVIVEAPLDSAIMREEYFAPLAPIHVFDGEEEALGIANGLPYGLAAYLFTASPERIDRMTGRLEAGGVFVNTTATVTEATPFSGIKESGYGYEGGQRGLDSYLHYRLVNTRIEARGL
ncbi:aldehyde dehydrogenase family protein [Shinella sp. PSBB067]|uniref:aldehyde dehydrogenase family protein n=1 Tax=Shinella TaxID=323620 RepID=UPI00193B2185|nr:MULTISPECIES: aldehyde dehydrogenase family protein [Shinella]QRI62544.1 aldehyde dehydrogenase family protein [Shinella sp. PSBB067]